MHIPYFADFYHICICKIDEITPPRSTAFLSPQQRYTFQIPPRAAASPLPGAGVPAAGMGVMPSPCHPAAEPSCGAVVLLRVREQTPWGKHIESQAGRVWGMAAYPSSCSPLVSALSFSLSLLQSQLISSFLLIFKRNQTGSPWRLLITQG